MPSEAPPCMRSGRKCLQPRYRSASSGLPELVGRLLNKAIQERALAETLDWSAAQPLWQRDALRRLFTAGSLAAADFDELLQLTKTKHGWRTGATRAAREGAFGDQRRIDQAGHLPSRSIETRQTSPRTLQFSSTLTGRRLITPCSSLPPQLPHPPSSPTARPGLQHARSESSNR